MSPQHNSAPDKRIVWLPEPLGSSDDADTNDGPIGLVVVVRVVVLVLGARGFCRHRTWFAIFGTFKHGTAPNSFQRSVLRIAQRTHFMWIVLELVGQYAKW